MPSPRTRSVPALAFLLSVVAAACGGGGGSSGSSSGPPPSAPVVVVRDAFGVAHVTATSDAGAYFGAGYAAAQDRLFQMCWGRVQIQGRVAEFFGPGTPLDGSTIPRNVYQDVSARLVGWRRHCEREANELAPSVRALLDAYAAGVNRELDDVRAGGPAAARHPMFAQYALPLDPWTAEDCIGAWYRMSRHYALDAWSEGKNLHVVETLRAQGRTDDEIRAYLFGGAVCDDDAAVVRMEDVPADVRARMAQYALDHDLDTIDACPGGVLAPHFSQAWAVAGSRSSTGRALLVADPRVPIYVPSAFYEWHMRGATFDVRGMGTPGSPNLLVGTSSDVAWGVTALALDQSDLFRVQPSPDDRGIVVDGALEAWSSDATETVRVRGGADVVFDARETRFGPMVTQAVLDVRPGEAYALRAMPFPYPERSTTAGFVDLYRARSAATFRAELAGWDYPSANVVFADDAGHIGYAAAGAWPVRPSSQAPPGTGTLFPGWAAQDGTRASNDWIGLLPHDLRPWVVDPASGVLFSANQMPVGSWYPLPHSFAAHGDNDRSRRLRERLSLGSFTPGDAFAPRTDALSPNFRDLAALAAFAADVQGHAFSPEARDALLVLRPWIAGGARMDHADAGTMLASRLPTTLRNTDPRAEPLVAIYGGGASGLCAYLKRASASLAHVPPPPLSSIELAFLDSALSSARASAIELAGATSNWGAWYRANVLSGRITEWTSLEGQDPLGGGWIDFEDVDCNEVDTLRSAGVACFTQAIEVGRPDATRTLLPFGQNERRASAHFDDQYALWLAGDLKAAPMGDAAVEQGGVESRIELDFP